MIKKLKQYEKIARKLDPDFKEREENTREVINYANQFLNDIYQLPAFINTRDQGRALYQSPFDDKGIEISEILKILYQNVDRPGINPASGGHLGYIPGGGIPYAALGDYLADITNKYAGIFFASPGAVRLENMLLSWMSGLIGYPEDAGGCLTSGGSIANLVGIVTARDAHQLKAKDFHRTVVYLTEQVHHSIDKALRISGLGEVIKRYVPMDEYYCMRADVLEDILIKDKRSGLYPWLIIASAGTTDTGAVDPLDLIGGISDKHCLWFHIDGAYGAFFALCQEGKSILRGIDKADSIIMDPHKGLFLPYGLGAVLVKNRQALYNSHYYQANYMQDAAEAQEEPSPADHSPELSKPFRGLRLWLPLKLLGIEPFRAALEEKLLLARYFYEKIQIIDGFEVGPFPDLSVVIFRYCPKSGDANAFNQRLVEAVQTDGRIFISSTMLNGTFTLRLAILAFRTHLDTIDMALEILQEKVRDLEKE